MKIVDLELRNFLLAGEHPLKIGEFGSVNTIVGPNNSGKTNIFRAIQFVAESLLHPPQNHHAYYHKGNHMNGFYIEIGIKLDPDEVDAASSLLSQAMMGDTVYMPNTNQDILSNIRNDMLNIQKLFHSIFSRKISVIINDLGKINFAPEVNLKITNNGNTLFVLDSNEFSLEADNSVIRDSLSQILINFLVEQNIFERRIRTNSFTPEDSEIISSLDFDWLVERLRTIGNRTHIGFQNVDLINIERFPEIPPYGKQLRDFLIRKGMNASALTLMGFFGLLFNYSVIRLLDLRSIPNQPLPNDFDSFHVPPIIRGQEIGLILFKLKTSTDLGERERYRLIQENFNRIMRPLSFDVALQSRAEPVTREKLVRIPYHETAGPLVPTEQREVLGIENVSDMTYVNEPVIYINNENYSVPIDFAAAGSIEILLSLTAIIGVRDKILLLDEPAQNLHPSKQIMLLQTISEAGGQDRGNQIFIITHSPYLVNSGLRKVWRLSADSNSCLAYNVDEILYSVRSRSEDENTDKRWLASPEIRSLLFSKGVVFVEGIIDKIVISLVDNYLSKKHTKTTLDMFELPVVEMGGKKTINALTRLATSFHIPYVAVMDYDALMRCDQKMTVIGQELPTSTIIKFLWSNHELSGEEIEKIKSFTDAVERTTTEKGVEMWYKKEVFEELNAMVKKRNFFVFSTDLEGQLRMPTTPKNRKALRNIQTVVNQIENNSLNEKEFGNLFQFIEERLTPKSD